MKFIDYVTIYVKAGDGGRGCISFRREKFIPRGGPDGGDGGRGGNIIIRTDNSLNTLLDLKYKKQYISKRGGLGMGRNMDGKDGNNLIIKVPAGTVVKDQLTEKIVADLNTPESGVTVAKGGRGGKGNAHFKSSTLQAPKFAQPGEKGEDAYLILELKLLADVGLIGMPNAGKSTFIASVSSARPKVADYPFTTLEPHLGMVRMDNFKSFVIADIPGIIEGAHKGAGLGLRFLRHSERTSLLLLLIDISDMVETDPVDTFRKLTDELNLYSSKLSEKKRAVVGTKLDISINGNNLKKLKDFCRTKNIPFYAISSITKVGISDLIGFVSKKL